MQILVVGAGVVGLAVARALAMRGHEVVVAERTAGIGNGTSSRNSEVIHGGMYYPTGSLRQRHCVAGRRALYAFCESHHVPHRRCGKLVVATSMTEILKIEAIHAQGLANGVDGLELLDAAAARALEPALRCEGALLSRETGIVDSHALMLALLGDLEAAGGSLALETPIERLRRVPEGWRVDFGGAEGEAVTVDGIVNAAGLDAQRLAQATEGLPDARIPKQVLAKGNYFTCSAPHGFRRLIYPAPVEGGLGIHATLDLAGRLRFGPDVEWIEWPDYAVDPARAALFTAAIRRYWPALPDGALQPDYAGIRPKLSGPGEPAADFVLDGPHQHGLPRLVHLYGIESPGLTASLSLAEAVADAIEA